MLILDKLILEVGHPGVQRNKRDLLRLWQPVEMVGLSFLPFPDHVLLHVKAHVHRLVNELLKLVFRYFHSVSS